MASLNTLAMRPLQKRYLKDTIRSGLPGRVKGSTHIMSTPFSGNLTTPYTPPFKVVRQYFIVATIAFILLNGLMLFSYQYIQGYHFQPRLLAFLAIILFAVNIGLTLCKVKTMNITVVHIIAAIIYLTTVATFGLLLGLNLSFPFLRGNHLHYLALHAAIGFAGWFSMVIMGVSYKLLPMFSLSYTYRTWPGWTAFWLFNMRILGIIVEFILGNPFYSAILIAAGLFIFSYQVRIIMAGRG